jgi:hypothetical protein
VVAGEGHDDNFAEVGNRGEEKSSHTLFMEDWGQ